MNDIATSENRLIGSPMPRVEDRAFLTGTGAFTDDLVLDGQVHAAVVRSPHAHAEILSVDADDALAADGVLAVYTAADLKAHGVKALPTSAGDPLPGGETERAITDAPQFPLADGRVRYVGEAVAFVVAETAAAANAESVTAASPADQTKERLSAAPSHSAGAPSARASAAEPSAGRGS